MTSSNPIVLAFSGGLDTSFCIPWLQERGWAVHTVFADTGGVDEEERDFIEKRAAELGAASHVTVDGGPAIWAGFVKPFVWAGEGYQGQYPLLVSDRYLIVDTAPTGHALRLLDLRGGDCRSLTRACMHRRHVRRHAGAERACLYCIPAGLARVDDAHDVAGVEHGRLLRSRFDR